MFERVLVANRGEIACRIFRTCRRLGIGTVAVYSEIDRNALHVRKADEAVCVGPASPSESYLVVERIVEAARRCGAEAVHPGYGFLAENPDFAEAVEAAGLCFVGPPVEAMRLLGDKHAAKELARTVGIPTLESFTTEGEDAETVMVRARRIGFPLLVKAIAGGGGKGMRRVETADGLPEALAACRREAQAAFGDGRLLIERWLDRPRHVEVQVMLDTRGNAVHLHSRDCSLQRRHQKILEEAPAPALDASLLQTMHEAALAIARAAGYRSAGTVEFLVDANHRFHFMEMNARLQVEHPVTEAICGVDLVEWQLRIAAGEALPCSQEDLRPLGHAFEARIYAEDPSRNFLPSAGRLEELTLPSGEEGIRVDTGVEAGDIASPHYDPMLAKIVSHGSDREQALRRLIRALDRAHVEGIRTNLPFLRRICRAPAVRAATIDTGWLDRQAPERALSDTEPVERLLPHAALAVIAWRAATPSVSVWCEANSPWNHRRGLRLGGPARQRVLLASNERIFDIEAVATGRGWRIEGPWGTWEAACGMLPDGRFWIEHDGRRRVFVGWLGPDRVTVCVDGVEARFTLPESPEAGEAEESEKGCVAPLPGRVVTVTVQAGDRVEKGAALVVLEAMKMEQKLTAPLSGRIRSVNVAAGELVEEGTVLVEIEPGE